MRILVSGSRHYENYDHVAKILEKFQPSEIIHGGAYGVDNLAGLWAQQNNVHMKVFPADWKTHGRAAGHIRNKQMLDEGKPDLVIAFLAPDSRGTKNMIEQAMKANIPVRIINI